MQTVLSQLNSVPGVVGSLVCNLDGALVAQVFPPVFDSAALQEMSRTLADGATGLDLSSETTELLDFRYKDGRLLAKPFPGSMLVVVCTKATNVQFLMLSVTAAVAKLEKLRPASVTSPRGTETRRATPAAEAGRGGDPRAKKVAAPSKGLDELRRRLADTSARPVADGSSPGLAHFQPPAARVKSEAQAKQDEAETSTTRGLKWWEGMS